MKKNVESPFTLQKGEGAKKWMENKEKSEIKWSRERRLGEMNGWDWKELGGAGEEEDNQSGAQKEGTQ